MVRKIKKVSAALFLIAAILLFYYPFLISFKLPVPADTIVGLYHPYRDFYAAPYPNGIPFKNFLITDPVRQTYIWKELAIGMLEKSHLPLWNPYEMTGKPLLANFQVGAFYPLNILLFIKPFYFSWSVFIIIQSILGGFFTFLYLKNLKLNALSAIIGSLAFIFSGFSISWLEWGTILQTGLWLPLVLFSIDKIFSNTHKSHATRYWTILCIALICSLFAGHLQVFTYLYGISFAYFFFRWFEEKRDIKKLLYFVLTNIIFIIITFIQWYPSLQFILLSSRNYDQSFLTTEGWFLPWKHLIQFVAPDFFGNPATINYYGTWNYQELVGYVGVIPLTLSVFSLFKKKATNIFFLAVLFFALLFALPTGISSIPYILNAPFLSSAQPTRLLFLVTFALSVMSAYGMQYIFETKKFSIKLITPIFLVGLTLISLWMLVFSKTDILFPHPQDIITAKRNLIVPTAVFILGGGILIFLFIIKNVRFRKLLLLLLVIIVFADLFRFGHKFLSFSSVSYLYPDTKVINFLKTRPGLFRVAVMDRRIMPPNFFTHYKIQTIEGYDPLYLNTYAEFIAALERNKPDITPPFGFNRIITPHNYNSQLFDLLNTKYILSYDEISSSKLVKVFSEGHTKVYENRNALPRAFFVTNVISSNSINSVFENDLATTAIITGPNTNMKNLTTGKINDIGYEENEVTISVSNSGSGFLVLSDAYYPTWKAYIDGKKTKIYLTDHAFRGIFIPKGQHVIQFKESLF
jgi:hypothetical protein